ATGYDKRFLSHTEGTGWHTPGRDPCVFEVEGWRFGCALCIELHFAEVFQQYAVLDVACVLCSAYADDARFGIQAQGYAASGFLERRAEAGDLRRFRLVQTPAGKEALERGGAALGEVFDERL